MLIVLHLYIPPAYTIHYIHSIVLHLYIPTVYTIHYIHSIVSHQYILLFSTSSPLSQHLLIHGTPYHKAHMHMHTLASLTPCLYPPPRAVHLCKATIQTRTLCKVHCTYTPSPSYSFIHLPTAYYTLHSPPPCPPLPPK